MSPRIKSNFTREESAEQFVGPGTVKDGKEYIRISFNDIDIEDEDEDEEEDEDEDEEDEEEGDGCAESFTR